MNTEIPDDITEDMIERMSDTETEMLMRIRMDLVRLSDLLPSPMGNYFDPSNLSNLRFKMDVLAKLEQGTPVSEIPGWESILDLPSDDTLWD